MSKLTCVRPSEMEVWIVQGEGWSSHVRGYSYAQATMFPTEVSHLTSEGIFPTTLHPVFRLGEVDTEGVIMSTNGAKASPVSSPPPLVYMIVVGGGGLWGGQHEGDANLVTVQD